jgi:hypothetical protein
MGEARGPAEGRYQLSEGTYRELIVKDRTTKFLKAQMRKLREDPRSYHLPEGKAEEARRHHADEAAWVKAAADQEVAAGKADCGAGMAGAGNALRPQARRGAELAPRREPRVADNRFDSS